MPDIRRPDLSGIDWDGLSGWGTRVAMASQGWMSQFQVERARQGQGAEWQFSIKHNEWHGSLAEVRMHSSGTLHEPGDEAIAALAQSMRTLAARGRAAWDEYTDRVPFQTGKHGLGLVEHASETDYLRSYPTPRVVLPERAWPTEALPGWPGQPSLAEFLGTDDGRDVWLQRALSHAATRNRWRYQDSLSSHHAGNGWQHENRQWIFEIDPYAFFWNDRQIMHKPTRIELSTRQLTPLATDLASAAALDYVETMERRYADGLPPGWAFYVPPPELPQIQDEPSEAPGP